MNNIQLGDNKELLIKLCNTANLRLKKLLELMEIKKFSEIDNELINCLSIILKKVQTINEVGFINNYKDHQHLISIQKCIENLMLHLRNYFNFHKNEKDLKHLAKTFIELTFSN